MRLFENILIGVFILTSAAHGWYGHDLKSIDCLLMAIFLRLSTIDESLRE